MVSKQVRRGESRQINVANGIRYLILRKGRTAAQLSRLTIESCGVGVGDGPTLHSVLRIVEAVTNCVNLRVEAMEHRVRLTLE